MEAVQTATENLSAAPVMGCEVPIVSTITTREMLEIADRKLVTGVFHHRQKKGGILRIGGMRKYKGDKLEGRTFIDGKTYTVPKWMADWLNGVDINDQARNPLKTPGAHKVVHNDQWVDLHDKRPLGSATYEPMYAFTPVAQW